MTTITTDTQTDCFTLACACAHGVTMLMASTFTHFAIFHCQYIQCYGLVIASPVLHLTQWSQFVGRLPVQCSHDTKPHTRAPHCVRSDHMTDWPPIRPPGATYISATWSIVRNRRNSSSSTVRWVLKRWTVLLLSALS